MRTVVSVEPKFVPLDWRWHNAGGSYQYILAWIPPADFLRLSQGYNQYITQFNLNTSFESSLVNAMRKGLPIEPPFLILKDAVITKEIGRYTKIVRANPKVQVEGDNYHGFAHEGRNRSAIAQRLGIKLEPVKFEIPYLKNWFQGYQTYDAIWEKPRIEAQILRYLNVFRYRLDKN